MGDKMQIRLAKHGGFCFGVKRAVDLVQACTQQGSVATLGPIIHNPQVVAHFERQGVNVVDHVSDVQTGMLVMRSHGARPEDYCQAQEQGLTIMDATCPYVERIHQMVKRHYEAGDQIVIIGERAHPEVIATNGWCQDQALILYEENDLKDLKTFENVCVVAQTTITASRFEHILSLLRPLCAKLKVYDTICSATSKRQTEAIELAGEVDAMVVIGGRNSSNTQKLAECCKRVCSHVFMVETAAELPLGKLAQFNIIGVTAGASTPDWIIKEVVSTMNELDRNEEVKDLQESAQEVEVAGQTVDQAEDQATVQNEAASSVESAEKMEDDTAEGSFAEAFEKTLVRIKNGQIIRGTVVQVNDNEVCVNIGYKSDGFIPRSELSSDDVNPTDVVKVGDEIEVEVIKVNDGEGNVLLSKKNIDNRKNWDKVLALIEEGAVLEGVGKEVVKGGLLASVMGIRTFVPASQLSTRYVEKIEEFVGQPLRLKSIEVDRSRKRVVASRKAVLEEETAAKKQAVMDQLEVGTTVDGIVRRLTDFGAFVDIGGVDGLVHVTDLSWGRIQHPSNVVKIGQKIQVVITGVDRERERISLSYKQLQPRPWEIAPQKYPVGSIVTGKVVRIVTFGAFVELEPGLDGLLHISQISRTRINKVEDALQVGDVIQVKVLEVDPDKKRISLSLRAVQDEQEEVAYVEEHQAASAHHQHQPAHQETVPEYTSGSATLADFFPKLDQDNSEE